MIFSILPLRVHAEDSTKVDWVNGYILATGYGTAKQGTNKAYAVISSKEAGKYLAMRSLLEAIKGVYIDSQVLVRDYIIEEDITRIKVEGLLKGAEVIDTKTTWEEGLPITAVTMRICMSAQGTGCEPGNTLIDTLQLNKFADSPLIPKKRYSQDTALRKPSQGTSDDDGLSKKSLNQVTGVIFSLQGHPFRRVLLPVVVTLSKDGSMSTVYSVKRVDPEIVIKYGIIRYANTLEQAGRIEKLGDEPLIIPIEKVTDDNILAISTNSAQKIYETTMHGNDYLRKANVAISSE
ncbi:MAG: hypothetical protein ACMUIU_03185 [bacterium]